MWDIVGGHHFLTDQLNRAALSIAQELEGI